MLSLHEKTAERSPPLSPPEGTAIMSQSKPASSNERCARSFPAHNSMQPKGRISVFMQSEKSRATFLEFVSAFTSAHPWNHISAAVPATRQAAINSKCLCFTYHGLPQEISPLSATTRISTHVNIIAMFNLNPRLSSVVTTL